MLYRKFLRQHVFIIEPKRGFIDELKGQWSFAFDMIWAHTRYEGSRSQSLRSTGPKSLIDSLEVIIQWNRKLKPRPYRSYQLSLGMLFSDSLHFKEVQRPQIEISKPISNQITTPWAHKSPTVKVYSFNTKSAWLLTHQMPIAKHLAKRLQRRVKESSTYPPPPTTTTKRRNHTKEMHGKI